MREYEYVGRSAVADGSRCAPHSVPRLGRTRCAYEVVHTGEVHWAVLVGKVRLMGFVGKAQSVKLDGKAHSVVWRFALPERGAEFEDREDSTPEPGLGASSILLEAVLDEGGPVPKVLRVGTAPASLVQAGFDVDAASFAADAAARVACTAEQSSAGERLVVLAEWQSEAQG